MNNWQWMPDATGARITAYFSLSTIYKQLFGTEYSPFEQKEQADLSSTSNYHWQLWATTAEQPVADLELDPNPIYGWEQIVTSQYLVLPVQILIGTILGISLHRLILQMLRSVNRSRYRNSNQTTESGIFLEASSTISWKIGTRTRKKIDLIPLFASLLLPSDMDIQACHEMDKDVDSCNDDFSSCDLEDIDVNQCVHDANMRRAMSMLSVVSSPPEDTASVQLLTAAPLDTTADTFTDEQQLLNLDLPLSFEQDSVEAMNTELSPDSETRNNNHHDSISIKRQSSEGEESSADSTSFVVATPGIERVESARIESLEEQHRKPTVYNETGHISVKAAARLFEKNISPISVTSRLPKPKIPTTPRQHRRSLRSPDQISKTRWDAFESTTPRKCAVNHTPHAQINAASGDREVNRCKKSETISTNCCRKIREIEDRQSGLKALRDRQCINDTVHNKKTKSSDVTDNEIVSETTEWVVYND
ncbi:uncharacterized protein LOC142335385 isoform X2 [Convolutriloba macropyga]|uniref:uncharacterized protein LOC142335385 isoform X2 n=1 Tax=Convolutriloba macropyga TaxID=536237 RepID=UPI003F51DF20